METNLHLDKKTEISSPIKKAISSHIDKWYAPKVHGDAGSPTSVNNTSSDNSGSVALNNSDFHAPVGMDNPYDIKD